MLVYRRDIFRLGSIRQDSLRACIAFFLCATTFVTTAPSTLSCVHKSPVGPSRLPVLPQPKTLTPTEQECLGAPHVEPGRVEDRACFAPRDSEIFALWATSHRCLRHIYLEDNADDAVVGALLDKLEAASPVAEATTALRETLRKARTRAGALFVLGPVIRALEIAFIEARFDHARNAWQGIDSEACRHAHEVWRTLDPGVRTSYQDFVALVDPIGHDTMASLLSLCAACR